MVGEAPSLERRAKSEVNVLHIFRTGLLIQWVALLHFRFLKEMEEPHGASTPVDGQASTRSDEIVRNVRRSSADVCADAGGSNTTRAARLPPVCQTMPKLDVTASKPRRENSAPGLTLAT